MDSITEIFLAQEFNSDLDLKEKVKIFSNDTHVLFSRGDSQ